MNILRVANAIECLSSIFTTHSFDCRWTSWMLSYKFCNIINIVSDYEMTVRELVMLCNVFNSVFLNYFFILIIDLIIWRWLFAYNHACFHRLQYFSWIMIMSISVCVKSLRSILSTMIFYYISSTRMSFKKGCQIVHSSFYCNEAITLFIMVS